MPGPALVIAARYDASPVGPYAELSINHPARVGLRPGWCVTTMAVSSQAARTGLQLNWGMPSEVGMVSWADATPDVGPSLVWEEGGLEIVGEPTGKAAPLVVPLRALQRRADGPVMVPRRFFGRTRFTRAHVRVDATDNDRGLAWLAGSHRALAVAGVRIVIHPARQPAGMLSSLRAPLRAPEAALADATARTGRVTLLPGA